MHLTTLACGLHVCAMPVRADERCDVLKDQWQPVEELPSELAAKG